MRPGGIIHTYQKYDPVQFPPPADASPNLASQALEHLLAFGDLREFTDEELAGAITLDPSQIAGLLPNLDSLLAMLLERKRKILQRYETATVREQAARQFREAAEQVSPPKAHRAAFHTAVREEQLYDLERLWYRQRRDASKFARELVQLMDLLGSQYQIEQLVGKYEFTGHEPLSIPDALAVKQELERIDALIEQLRHARQTAQLAVIDMSALAEYAEPRDLQQLTEFQQMLERYLRDLAEQQGLQRGPRGYQITPKAQRLFQGALLARIFGQLQQTRSGRHAGLLAEDGAVELPNTRPYVFGDSPSQMDIPQTFLNALVRQRGEGPLTFRSEDIEVHRTRKSTKCATAVIMDMSGSMRYSGQYINVKKVALALDALIRRDFPGDYLAFIEMYTFARQRSISEIASLLPKPVTIMEPWVRQKADMSRQEMAEPLIHPHFTNIQRALQLARQLLSHQNTRNRQVVLITDGLPTAHFEGSWLYLLYPPDPRTERATLREAMLCQRDGITINVFLLSSWSQTREDVRFAYRLAESTSGRVFFAAGKELDRFVLWDYLLRKREVIH